MDRGLYIAASGMLAELTRQDQVANDLANASTPGYKQDRAAQAGFGDLLVSDPRTGAPIGHQSAGVKIDALATDLAQAPLRETDEPLDVALQGDGFLAVQTPQGVRYTRNGQLALDATGGLVTTTGYPVLDDAGKPIALTPGAKVTIAADGTISGGPKLGVVSLANAAKQGDNFFIGTPGARPAGTQVKQGFLEGSGVDPARAMVDMIVSMRAYEASQRVIHAIDETLGKGIASVGGA
jgi:flagellar basal-body rod protein FlgF